MNITLTFRCYLRISRMNEWMDVIEMVIFMDGGETMNFRLDGPYI